MPSCVIGCQVCHYWKFHFCGQNVVVLLLYLTQYFSLANTAGSGTYHVSDKSFVLGMARSNHKTSLVIAQHPHRISTRFDVHFLCVDQSMSKDTHQMLLFIPLSSRQAPKHQSDQFPPIKQARISKNRGAAGSAVECWNIDQIGILIENRNVIQNDSPNQFTHKSPSVPNTE